MPTSVAYTQCLSRWRQCMWGWCKVTHHLHVLFAGCHRGCYSVLYKRHPDFVKWPHSFIVQVHQSEKNNISGRNWAWESKQEGLSLKLREEDLKINIRMLWKDISQSSKLCRPTYASPCSQLLFPVIHAQSSLGRFLTAMNCQRYNSRNIPSTGIT